MANDGTLRIRVVGDVADAQAKMGQLGGVFDRLGGGAKAAFGVVGGAAALGFGIATKGALEAEAAQGKFMAATGATREEAKAFVSDMNGLAGSAGAIGVSFDDIAAAGTAVSQQFGVTGKDAQELTGDILNFAKVTGQDAAHAAGDLEDALSAFGLEAGDAAPAMDKLVASSQKYGTDAGPAAVGALNDMAPALVAMGMGLDDGVELLNAFEVAGGDAGDAAKGLRTAVAQLKPGENIDDLIAKIAAIEDPLLKNQAATDAFGKKMGPQLAALIKPGMTSLDEFGISAEEAAGKTDKAADDMLTLTDRMKGFADKLVAGAREIGNEFGPAITGLASLASLGAPFARELGSLFKGLIVKVLPSAAAVGTATGGAQATAHEAAATGPGVVRSLFAKIAAMAIPLAPAGTTIGTAIGGMVGPGILLGIGAGVGLAAEAHGPQIGRQIHDAIFGEGNTVLEAGKVWGMSYAEGIGKGLSTEEARAYAMKGVRFIYGDSVSVQEAEGAAYQLGLVSGEAIGRGTEEALKAEGNRWIGYAQSQRPAVEEAFSGLGRTAGESFWTEAGRSSSGTFEGAWSRLQSSGSWAEDGRNAGETFGRSAVDGVSEFKNQFGEAAGAMGKAGTDALADKLADGIPDIRDQWKAYIQATKDALDPMKQITWLEARLSGDKLAEGLESKNPITRRKAELMRDAILQQIDDLKRLMGIEGEEGGDAVGDGLVTPANKSNATRAGRTLADNAKAGFSDQPWNTWGAGAYDQWERGFLGDLSKLNAKIRAQIRVGVGALISESPVREGPLTNLARWGRNAANEWIGAFVAPFGALPLSPTLAGLGRALTPSLGGSLAFAGTTAVAGGGSTSSVRDVTINIYDARDPEAVASKVREVLGDVLGGFQPRYRHTTVTAG